MKIAPSILSANFADLKTDIKKVENAEYLHIDIMDGHFVDNLTFGSNVVKALRKESKKIFDCHLMVENPEKYLEDLSVAGADIIGIHFEGNYHLHRTLEKIKKLDMKSSVVINPATPVSVLKEVLPLVNQVLVMTVDPGFGGQLFIKEMLSKIEELVKIRNEKAYHFEIEVDGGINDETIALVAKAGADIAVAGSFVFNSENPTKQVEKLREVAEKWK